ncbi:hypothetical protein LZ31DRAFT_559895 [Colletotrichum somersetense]|nr:hypothetical protein LZ31DRAFT_559895 [Colletotrichum somersetense]
MSRGIQMLISSSRRQQPILTSATYKIFFWFQCTHIAQTPRSHSRPTTAKNKMLSWKFTANYPCLRRRRDRVSRHSQRLQCRTFRSETDSISPVSTRPLMRRQLVSITAWLTPVARASFSGNEEPSRNTPRCQLYAVHASQIPPQSKANLMVYDKGCSDVAGPMKRHQVALFLSSDDDAYCEFVKIPHNIGYLLIRTGTSLIANRLPKGAKGVGTRVHVEKETRVLCPRSGPTTDRSAPPPRPRWQANGEAHIPAASIPNALRNKKLE